MFFFLCVNICSVPTRVVCLLLQLFLTFFSIFLCFPSSRCLPLLGIFRSALRALPRTLPPPPSWPAAAAPVRCCMYPLFMFVFFLFASSLGRAALVATIRSKPFFHCSYRSFPLFFFFISFLFCRRDSSFFRHRRHSRRAGWQFHRTSSAAG